MCLPPPLPYAQPPNPEDPTRPTRPRRIVPAVQHYHSQSAVVKNPQRPAVNGAADPRSNDPPACPSSRCITANRPRRYSTVDNFVRPSDENRPSITVRVRPWVTWPVRLVVPSRERQVLRRDVLRRRFSRIRDGSRLLNEATWRDAGCHRLFHRYPRGGDHPASADRWEFFLYI